MKLEKAVEKLMMFPAMKYSSFNAGTNDSSIKRR